MKKNVIRLNEGQLKRLIKEAVNKAMYDFGTTEPQYDINSDEWNSHYDEMSTDAEGRNRMDNDKLMNQQVRHHFGEKGNKEGAHFEKRSYRPYGQNKKRDAMSERTIEFEVMKALNNGKSPEEIMNLKPFTDDEKERIMYDSIVDYLEPVGTIDKAGKIVFYDTRKGEFKATYDNIGNKNIGYRSYDDDREY